MKLKNFKRNINKNTKTLKIHKRNFQKIHDYKKFGKILKKQKNNTENVL